MTSVRRALAGDISEFKNVVIESVLELCKNHYTSEQLNSLLAQYPSRDIYERWLEERVLLVAEEGGKIVGFAQYFPPNSALEAVHVLPGYLKQGVGKMLVRSIEKLARKQVARKIVLDSSLNAVGFYEKCGYIRKRSGTFTCNDGTGLEVVGYEKVLRS